MKAQGGGGKELFSPIHGVRSSTGPGLPHYREYTIRLKTHYIWYGSSGRGIGPTHRPGPDNTQYSQKTDIYVSGGIRTRNPIKRATADPLLRRRSHWDRRSRGISPLILNSSARCGWVLNANVRPLRAGNNSGTHRCDGLLPSSVYYFNLKIEPVRASEYCVSLYQTARSHIPEDIIE